MKHFLAASRCLVVLSGIMASRLSAQAITDTATVDHIVAVVGSKAILSSQVQEELYARVSNGDEKPPDTKDPAAFAKVLRRYVDTLVAFELLYREAVADTTIKVTDQEVQESADQLIQNARRRFKTEVEFVNALKTSGFSSAEDWRSSLLDKQRRSLTVRRFQSSLKDQNKIKAMVPTEKEMRAFYDAHIDLFGSYPAAISMKQLVIAPKPTDAAKARAKALADSIVIELRKGTDFAVMARQFSMDSVSKAAGGDLGWFRRGLMVPEFEDAAFSLKVGQVSDPVESPFGYHIIQVQRTNPGERQARHILIMPEIDSAGAKAAHDKAVEVDSLIRHGASFDSLQHIYHDRAEEQELTDYPVDSLMKTAYGAVIANVDSGKVSAVFELPVKDLRSKWAMVYVTRRTAAGPRPYIDVKEQLRTGLGLQMGQQDYINQLRKRTYVDIREP